LQPSDRSLYLQQFAVALQYLPPGLLSLCGRCYVRVWDTCPAVASSARAATGTALIARVGARAHISTVVVVPHKTAALGPSVHRVPAAAHLSIYHHVTGRFPTVIIGIYATGGHLGEDIRNKCPGIYGDKTDLAVQIYRRTTKKSFRFFPGKGIFHKERPVAPIGP